MGGIDVRDVFPAEQVFHFPDLELALREARIAAVGLALVADGGEPVRVDGQAEQLVTMGTQGGGQLQTLHVLFGERVVGRADTELHRHVQARRRLA